MSKLKLFSFLSVLSLSQAQLSLSSADDSSSLIAYGVADGDLECTTWTGGRDCLGIDLGFTFKLGHSQQQQQQRSFSRVSILLNGSMLLAEDESLLLLSVYANDYNYALGGSIYYRSVREQTVLDSLDCQINSACPAASGLFSVTRAFVATWHNVVEQASARRNTFQSVLATDERGAYFLFLNFAECQSVNSQSSFSVNESFVQTLTPWKNNQTDNQFIYLVYGSGKFLLTSVFSVVNKKFLQFIARNINIISDSRQIFFL